MGTNTDTDDDQRTSLPRRLTLLLRTAPSVRKSDPNTRTRDNEKKSTMVTSRKTRSLSVATLGVALLLGASRAAALPIELAPEMNDTAGNLTETANDTIADDENLGVGGRGPIELAPEMSDTMAGNLTVGNLTEIANDIIADDGNLDPGFSPGRRSLQFQGLQPPQPIFIPGRRSLQRLKPPRSLGPIELAPEMNDTAGNLTVGNLTEMANDTIADDENLAWGGSGESPLISPPR